jgi:Domain of unknown function (DUF4386)
MAMSERSARRVGASAGVVFTLLYSVGSGLLVGPINQSDSLATAARKFNEQAHSYNVAATLLIVGVPFSLLFAASLRAVLGRAEGGERQLSSLTLAGAAASGAVLLAGAALMGGTAYLAHYRSVDGATAAFAHSACEACVVFLGVAALVTGWIAIRHAVFPRWFGWLAAVLGTAMIVGSAGFPLIRPLALLANIATVLFILSTSVVIWTSNPAREPTPQPEKTASAGPLR